MRTGYASTRIEYAETRIKSRQNAILFLILFSQREMMSLFGSSACTGWKVKRAQNHQI
jgi:hypothetical protein